MKHKNISYWNSLVFSCASFSTGYLANSKITGDEFCKTNASRAVDATSHWGFDQGTKIFVFNTTFVFIVPAFSVFLHWRNILKVAFASLITNWAILWMVCRKEFHDTTIIILNLLPIKFQPQSHPCDFY